MRSVTTKPPKILIAAKKAATNPKIDETPKIGEELAIIAPRIMIPEIALVIDIKGVCSEGV